MRTVGESELKAAAQYARGLMPELTPQKKAELRDRAAREFFDADGIPPHLKQGWAVLEQARAARAEVGYPLPPGGCFLLGYEATVAGALADLHTLVAQALKMDPKHIRVRLRGTRPVAEVAPPKDWLLPIAAKPDESPDVAMKRLLEQIMQPLQVWFRQQLLARLSQCDQVRGDL